MSAPKKFFVFTATGDQGFSVARYLVKDREFQVWGLTRNTESPKAKELAGLGVKVVQGDMDHPETYEPYLDGIYGAFVNADFWTEFARNGGDSKGAGDYEYKIATAALDAVGKAGAKHIVYSALDDIQWVPHIGMKYNASQFAKSAGYPTTDLYTSHYISNITKHPQMLKAEGNGLVLQVAAPDSTPLVNYAPQQTGGWVLAIVKDPKKYIGKRVDAISEYVTVGEWAKILSEVIGKPVRTNGIPENIFDDYSFLTGMGIPEELILNYKAFHQKLAPRDLKASFEVFPDAWDTKAWAKNTGALDYLKA